MRVSEQVGDGELFGTAGEAVAAVGAAIALHSRKPVACVLKHAVAVLAVGGHIVGDRQISQTQNLGNVDRFGAGEAGITLAALIRTKLS